MALAVAGYAAYLFLTWWLLTHRLDRFWLPMLPALAILAGLGADWSSRLEWRATRGVILAIALVTSFVYCSTALCGLNEWTGSLTFLRRDLPLQAQHSPGRDRRRAAAGREDPSRRPGRGVPRPP